MAQGAENLTSQFLAFSLGDEQYGIDISRIREVLEYETVTQIPKVPDYMIGVINLRGSSVPVINLRTKLMMDEADRTVDTCIIITDVTTGDESVTLGILVDSVKEVFDLDPEEVEPPPQIGGQIDTRFIKGMGKHQGEFLILLDTDKIFGEGELAGLES